jgi:hypothetical protein
MSETVEVVALGPHEYAVTVREGETTTHHQVSVARDLVMDLGLPDADEASLVRESFSFLLEREPATSILPRFGLDEISRYFPDYRRELAARLG